MANVIDLCEYLGSYVDYLGFSCSLIQKSLHGLPLDPKDGEGKVTYALLLDKSCLHETLNTKYTQKKANHW